MSPPKLYCQPGGIGGQLLQQCTSVKRPFVPSFWAPTKHSQNVLSLLRTLSVRGSYTRQHIMTDDGGTLGLDWWQGSDKPGAAPATAPILLIIHGINGGSHEGYCKGAAMAAAARGWRAVVLNLRGCGGLPLTSARGYNALQTHDLHVAITSIQSRFPGAPLLGAGFSLGSVLLAKYLAEADHGLYSSAGAGSGLVAAALVSPPICLHSTNAKLGRRNSLDFMYNLAVAYKLREYVREHLPSIVAHGMNLDVAAMLRGWTVASFDRAVTLQALGYPAAHHYYRHACSTNYLPHVRTPTLILASRDDPFLGVLPKAQVAANPFLAMAVTRRGGHLAFLEGWWPLGASWMDAAFTDWCDVALRVAAADAGRRSWTQRAVDQGWVERPIDPVLLAGVMCTCRAPADPESEAAATDAVLNSVAAPLVTALGGGNTEVAAVQAAAAAAGAAPLPGGGPSRKTAGLLLGQPVAPSSSSAPGMLPAAVTGSAPPTGQQAGSSCSGTAPTPFSKL